MRRRLQRLKSSIFTKLIAVSVGTGLSISTSVALFFLLLIHPLYRIMPPEQQAHLQVVHDRVLGVLLLLLVVLVLVGHAILRRILAPVRWLQQGIEAMREGDLQVVVPQRSSDELGELTRAFNQMVQRVNEMLRARDQLLLDVSHELRSPLTRMKVALALCPPNEHNERLKTNVNEMERLVSELLELERLRHGHGLQLEQHDLMEIVRDAVAAFQDIAPGVVLDKAPEQLAMTLDGDKIRAVIGNLLDNASKYALPNSVATRISVVQADSQVQVCIVDDGSGIPSDDLGSLFDPFFRVDRSRSKRTGGYGLGLSLCRRVIEAHGGSIMVHNNAARGVTFTFVLPKRP